VGRSLLKKLFAAKDTVEQVAAISDEAMALLGIKNGVERWDDIFTRCEGDIRPYAKGQKISEAHKSTVPTKYTVSSNPDANPDKEGTNKVWSNEGIIRFNLLHQGIIEDRVAHPEFLLTWLAQERDLIAADQTPSNTGQDKMVNADDDFANPSSRNQTEELRQAAQLANVLDNTSVQHASESEDEDDGFGSKGN
jgi:hypothetical protein